MRLFYVELIVHQNHRKHSKMYLLSTWSNCTIYQRITYYTLLQRLQWQKQSFLSLPFFFFLNVQSTGLEQTLIKRKTSFHLIVKITSSCVPYDLTMRLIKIAALTSAGFNNCGCGIWCSCSWSSIIHASVTRIVPGSWSTADTAAASWKGTANENPLSQIRLRNDLVDVLKISLSPLLLK